MNENIFIEVCVHCEKIDRNNQRIYQRADFIFCPKCGNNEWVLICGDKVLEALEAFDNQ